MLADLVQVDVPAWIQYVALTAGLLAAFRIIYTWLPVHWTTQRIREQTNQYIDERIDEKLDPIIERQRSIEIDVRAILEQLSENHGTSALDKLNRIDANVTRIVTDRNSGSRPSGTDRPHST